MLSWDSCLHVHVRGLSVGCPDGNWSCSWGVAGDRERVWPLFNVLADVDTGAFGLVLALQIIQHHYEVLAIWLRARLS